MDQKLIKKPILSPNAPKPNGPYSQAVLYDRTLYISGQLGFDKDTNKIVEGGVLAEARQALCNMGKILEEGGSSFQHVLKVTIFLSDINDFEAVNDVYKEFFPCKCGPPARSTFQVGQLPFCGSIEIEAIAAIGETGTS